MAEYIINGGKRICGEFVPNGAKNAALPILAASVLTRGENCFYKCPEIADVFTMKEILRNIGCTVERHGDALTVDSSGIRCCEIPVDLMKKMRSSIFLAGPLLVRCGKVVISQPGGCSIGKRPIDLHINALKKLGACVTENEDGLVLTATKMKGANIILDYPSVGATENVMMAALGAEGMTVIHNAAREPEIIDLQNYLNRCGADIRGAGTSRITVYGGNRLLGTSYSIMSDRIEAGTFLIASACTGGYISVKEIDPGWLKNCCRLLRFSGCEIIKRPGEILLSAPERLYAAGKIKTGPYPGFSTDLQPQLAAAMTIAVGTTMVEETVFENRYGFTKELIKMGADIEISRGIAIIKGKEFLTGACVEAEDLRGGAALVLAALAAKDKTVVRNTGFIERGYCDFHLELGKLGADIEKCI